MQEEMGPDPSELEQPLQEQELIENPETIEEELEKMWSGEIDIDTLKQQFSLQREQSGQKTARDDPFLASVSEDSGDSRPEPFDKVVVLTSSSTKQEIVSDIAAETGISTQPTLQTELISEEMLRRSIQDLETEPQIKAVDLADLKREGLPHSEDPVLSMDTIVIDQNGRMIDKPGDNKAASAMITSMSGQNIRVVTGLTLNCPISEGKGLILREGVEIGLKLRNLSAEEISQYLESQGDKVQKIAGGIDFSNEAGQNLIDDSEAITVNPLRLAGVSNIEQDEIQITKQAVPALRTYFLGAPKHPIKCLLNQASQISENW